ncbi:DUF2249 domain-containing protein [Prosthecomicrobium sp. N25]|uniref:DUF2249 domain-containing protein n=1 Tax=Prosthecomicrobium sp. N25 TaxID=3129254 RepID=UPI003076A3CF
MSDTCDDCVIDVRTLPRPQRHVLVFRRFEALAPGEAIEIVNDHDPVGLLYGFGEVYPGAFRWEYLKRGPADWHVRIGREAAPVDEAAATHVHGCACGSRTGSCG